MNVFLWLRGVCAWPTVGDTSGIVSLGLIVDTVVVANRMSDVREVPWTDHKHAFTLILMQASQTCTGRHGLIRKQECNNLIKNKLLRLIWQIGANNLLKTSYYVLFGK